MKTALTVLLVCTHIPVWYTALIDVAAVAGIVVAVKWTTW